MFRSFLRPFRHLPSSLPSPSPTLRLLSTTPESTHIPLKSIYLARTIDVIGVYQTVFGDGYVHKFGKDSVIVELPRERGGGGTIKGRIDELNEKGE